MSQLDKIFASAVDIGKERLHKNIFATSISGFVAGVYVTFGGLIALTVTGLMAEFTQSHALSWFVGSIFYPIGFLFVIIGRSELFTENFLHPVLAILEGEASHKDAAALWSFGFVFNIVGVVVMVFVIWLSGLITSNHELGPFVVDEFTRVATHSLSHDLVLTFWKAIFAGILINFMSWLLVSCETSSSKIPIIWSTTFPIMLLGTHHSIVGSAEVLIGLSHGATGTYLEWFTSFLIPVAIGNHVGGVVFVGFLHYLHSTLHLLELET